MARWSEATPAPGTPAPGIDEAIDDQARDPITVGELVQQEGPAAFLPVPLEDVEEDGA